MFQTTIVSPDEIVLQVSGSMTGEWVARFEAALAALEKSHYRRITLDLSEVTEVSSLFVGHILQTHLKLDTQNRQIRICGYQEPVGDILKMLNVDKTVHIQPRSPGGEGAPA